MASENAPLVAAGQEARVRRWVAHEDAAFRQALGIVLRFSDSQTIIRPRPAQAFDQEPVDREIRFADDRCALASFAGLSEKVSASAAASRRRRNQQIQVVPSGISSVSGAGDGQGPRWRPSAR